MRHEFPLPIPQANRTCAIRVEDNPDGPGVVVTACGGGSATMSVAGYLATCRLCPDGIVRSDRVLAAVTSSDEAAWDR